MSPQPRPGDLGWEHGAPAPGGALSPVPRTLPDMGFKQWFTRTPATSNAQPPAPAAGPRSQDGGGQPVKLSGTTTFGADAADRLFRAHGQHAGGMLELPGHLMPEPENTADPNAVAVHVEGKRVGYLPAHVAATLPFASGEVLPCRVQLWAAETGDRLRVVGWVAAGTVPELSGLLAAVPPPLPPG